LRHSLEGHKKTPLFRKQKPTYQEALHIIRKFSQPGVQPLIKIPAQCQRDVLRSF